MGPQQEMISGDLEPNSAAWIIHYPIQRARPDLKCLIHVHTPYATAMSMRSDITFNDRASQAAAHFFDSVAYFETYDGSTEAEEGEQMAEALGNKRVLIDEKPRLSGGRARPSVTPGANMYLFERACMYQMLAGEQGTLSLFSSGGRPFDSRAILPRVVVGNALQQSLQDVG